MSHETDAFDDLLFGRGEEDDNMPPRLGSFAHRLTRPPPTEPRRTFASRTIQRLTDERNLYLYALKAIVQRLDYVPRSGDPLDALNMAKDAIAGRPVRWKLTP